VEGTGCQSEQPFDDHWRDAERTYQMKAENPYSAPTTINEEAMHVRGYRVPFSRIFVAWLFFSLITILGSVALFLAIIVFVALLRAVDSYTSIALGRLNQMIESLFDHLVFLVPIPVSLLCYWWSLRRIILKKLEPPS